jgi:hypothetical protein
MQIYLKGLSSWKCMLQLCHNETPSCRNHKEHSHPQKINSRRHYWLPLILYYLSILGIDLFYLSSWRMTMYCIFNVSKYMYFMFISGSLCTLENGTVSVRFNYILNVAFEYVWKTSLFTVYLISDCQIKLCLYYTIEIFVQVFEKAYNIFMLLSSIYFEMFLDSLLKKLYLIWKTIIPYFNF